MKGHGRRQFVAYLKVISYHLPGKIDENHEKMWSILVLTGHLVTNRLPSYLNHRYKSRTSNAASKWTRSIIVLGEANGQPMLRHSQSRVSASFLLYCRANCNSSTHAHFDHIY
jgi:hypothetical protein